MAYGFKSRLSHQNEKKTKSVFFWFLVSYTGWVYFEVSIAPGLVRPDKLG